MDKYIDKEERTDNNSKTFHFQISRVNDFNSSEIRQIEPLENSNQNMISVEQFDKAGQQISNIIRGDSI